VELAAGCGIVGLEDHRVELVTEETTQDLGEVEDKYLRWAPTLPSQSPLHPLRPARVQSAAEARPVSPPSISNATIKKLKIVNSDDVFLEDPLEA
jgi:hypothetical protein